MKFIPETVFTRADSRHLASETHLRIQILEIPNTDAPPGFFDIRHGELLIIVLSGSGVLETRDASQSLKKGDQALVTQSESFRLVPSAQPSDLFVQMIWAPGPHACKTCAELISATDSPE